VAARAPFARVRARFTGLVFAHPRLAELLSVRSALLSAVVPAPMVVPPSSPVQAAGSAPATPGSASPSTP
jgi:hypothetical protein